ncbi:MAG: asparagine synthase-related protein [Candidatus Bathyarchaeia archaeon]
MRATIAVLDKTGENAVPAIVAALNKLFPDGYRCIGIATPFKIAAEESFRRAEGFRSPTAAIIATSATGMGEESLLIRLKNEALLFDGRVYSPAPKTSASEIIAKRLARDGRGTAERVLRSVEGDFALTIVEPQKLTVARDPVGVQPLYYGENEAMAAVASNRRALWTLGVEDAKCFLPGQVASITKEGFEFKPVKTLAYVEPKPISMLEAAKTLQKLLEKSVRRRVRGVKEVAVAFSGGLDSSIVAFLAKKCGVDVSLIHVSLENQPETEAAQRAALELDLPLWMKILKEADVETVVAKVVELVEEPDPVKASVGVPFYWTAQKAAEAGFKVLLAGQGADELFGGYQRYVNEYILYGDEQVRKTMFNDVVNIHDTNIERAVKICRFHGVELRLPFASFELAEFALSLPTELKLEKRADSLRKLVLRKAAEKMGLSAEIACKPKKAVQYSTGVNNALRHIAKKRNLTLAEYIEELFQKQIN